MRKAEKVMISKAEWVIKIWKERARPMTIEREPLGPPDLRHLEMDTAINEMEEAIKKLRGEG